MNKSEKDLQVALNQYSKGVYEYGRTMLNVLIEIDRLHDLEGQINVALETINNTKTDIRPLNFMQHLAQLPTINQEIINSIKARIKMK